MKTLPITLLLTVASLTISCSTVKDAVTLNTATGETVKTALPDTDQTKQTKNSSQLETQDITPDIAGKYAIYAMLASNAYHKKDRVRFSVEKLGWKLVDINGQETSEATVEKRSGLAYDIYEKAGANEVVFAIRGTDSRRDYLYANFTIPPFSIQYKQMNREFGEYVEKHPNKKIVITGHSLGGGLALSVSVRYGIDAITFDPSPRIFDGLGDNIRPAKRIVIYQEGEILQKVRKYWRKIFEVVSKDNIYRCSFDFKGKSNHRGDLLALNLLKFGVTSNKELLPVYEAIENH